MTYLDLEKVVDKKTKSLFGNNLKIPIQPGKYQCEWDVMEEELPKELVVKLREYAKNNLIQEVGSSDKWTPDQRKYCHSRPMGFDTYTLPKGARIVIEIT